VYVDLLNRYSRQLGLLGRDGQERLGKASAAVFGVGGLGSHVAYYLAAGGLRRLILVDMDEVSLPDLHRQVLYAERDVGRRKVEAAAERLKAINRSVEVVPIGEPISPSLALKVAEEADVVIDALDNWAARHVVNRAAVQRRKPLVHGAVQEWYGQVTTIIPGVTPCLEEVFGRFRSLPSCGQGVCQVLGPVVGVVASIMALEAFRVLLGSPALAGRLLVVDLKHMALDEIRLERDERCPVCGYVR
jgi:molybdopterin/thiamine biosynthesis adenylyltransferase